MAQKATLNHLFNSIIPCSPSIYSCWLYVANERTFTAHWIMILAWLIKKI